jgi:hypothetical protein
MTASRTAVAAIRPPCLKGLVMSPGTRSARGLGRARSSSPSFASELSTQPCSHRHRRLAGIGRWASDSRSSADGPTVGIPRGLRLHRQPDALAGPMADRSNERRPGSGSPSRAFRQDTGPLSVSTPAKGEKSTKPTTNGPFLRGLGAGRRAQSTPREGPVDERSFRVYP